MSEDLRWMEVLMDYQSVKNTITRLCLVWGVPGQIDDVVQEAMLQACMRRDYDPGRSDLETYIVNHAKWLLLESFKKEVKEVPREITDEPEEPWHVLSPVVEEVEIEHMPFWYKALWVSLTEQERECLSYVLLASSRGHRASYRELGKVLGVNHVKAGEILKEVRRKARKAIAWTKALDRLVDSWANAGTFRGTSVTLLQR